MKKISRLKELKLNRASFPVHKLQKLRLEDVRCSYMINAMISGYSATAAAAAAAEWQDCVVGDWLVVVERPAALADGPTDGFNWRWCDCGVRRRATNRVAATPLQSDFLLETLAGLCACRTRIRAPCKLIPGGNAPMCQYVALYARLSSPDLKSATSVMQPMHCALFYFLLFFFFYVVRCLLVATTVKSVICHRETKISGR